MRVSKRYVVQENSELSAWNEFFDVGNRTEVALHHGWPDKESGHLALGLSGTCGWTRKRVSPDYCLLC